MKYIRLTKEQLEAMHEDFARFLATQQITAEQWNKIKKESPQVAEEELDIFSDLVWEKVLTQANYLEKREPQSFFAFKCDDKKMTMIGIRLKNNHQDLTTQKGFKWMIENLNHSDISIYNGEKKYQKERNLEVFSLVQQGAEICQGEFYVSLEKFISKKS